MADLGRKDFTEQAKEKATPDSQKSTLDQAKESVSGTADRLAGSMQPNDQKSTQQQIFDSGRGTSDDVSNQSKGYVEQARDTVGGAAQSVADTISGQPKK
ncbi:heat shock protein 9/12-domain-containing protein [Lineolata rhizophorae]|uniref:Heat shock protein 9/12-domain-containing protein n=1 Tax=Lineolata rhizophorae TaxID=578093 RepID=A0A6A6NQ24_9PEZI|nr:heat shock protein 9/12-domain-containing protein [Lineolata rhizophorae]